CNGTGVCQGGTPALDCNDGNSCTADTCNPTSGCVHTDTSASCNDANVCTADACIPATGCAHTTLFCPTTPPVATVDADTSVNSASPAANTGTTIQLHVDAGPGVLQTHVRVTVGGLGLRTVTSAKLRLKAATTSNANSVSGGRIHVTDCSWSETGITFNNRPAITPAVLSTVGAVALGQVVDFDVSSAISGDGTYCFA